MKTRQLIFIFLLFGFFSQLAQSGLSNLSFESWSNNAWGYAPTGWFGFNISKQGTGAQQGSSYIRISNTNINQGAVMLGSVTTGTGPVKGGAPYNQIPVSINGFFRTSGLATNDMVGISAYTSKSGTINANAVFAQGSNVATWTSFTASFTPFGQPAVDSIFIVAMSGNPTGPGTNSVSAILELDNMSIDGGVTTSIDKRSIGTSFMVYPNPASLELNIISKYEHVVTVIITDLAGKLEDELLLQAEKTSLDLKNYEAGVYFYSILNQENETVLTGKFVVIK